MSALETIAAHKHERVSIFTDRELGITALIAVHDTTLGPALGGCRIRAYHSVEEALYDVLRLAEGMTYKNSLAGLNIGGGKAVIIADRNLKTGRIDLFRKFGHWVNSFSGSYISAEDMGTNVTDIETMHQVTNHVTGCDPSKGGGGDPSPHTAQGVFDGIKSCLERSFGTSDLKDRHVAIQGVGAVGYHLAKHLISAGAKLTVADTSESQLKRASSEFNAQVVSVDNIYDVPCDVFAPCAVGAIINSKTVNRFNCKIIAGAANNQLELPSDEATLASRGIIYAPDFAINAGGVIMCADEIEVGGYTPSRVKERVGKIGNTVAKILDQAQASGKLAGVIAEELAISRIERVRAEKALTKSV